MTRSGRNGTSMSNQGLTDKLLFVCRAVLRIIQNLSPQDQNRGNPLGFSSQVVLLTS